MERHIQKDDDISLKELILKFQEWWKYLLSKWIIILIGGITGGILGLVYASLKKPLYIAELTFVLEGGKQGGAGNYAGLANQFGLDLGSSGSGGVFEGENLFALMKSRSMIEKTLLTTVDIKGKKVTLAEYYIDMNKMRDKWAKANSKLKNIRFLPGANPVEFSLQQNSLISSFRSALVADNLFLGNADKKSSIMSIKVTSEDELFSKYFTEVLAKEVSDFYIDTKIKKAKRNVDILRYQTDSVRKEFNSAIARAASSADANPNVDPTRQTLQVPYQRRQVDAEANQAMLVELMKNLAVSQNSLREQTPLIQVVDRPVLPLAVLIVNKLNMIIKGGLYGGFLIMLGLILKKLYNTF
jgi:hypothetical protein